MKAIGPEVNLSYPTRRQNFANTVDTLCAHYLTLRLKTLIRVEKVPRHKTFQVINVQFQCQDIYPELMEDLQKLVASPLVTGATPIQSILSNN